MAVDHPKSFINTQLHVHVCLHGIRGHFTQTMYSVTEYLTLEKVVRTFIQISAHNGKFTHVHGQKATQYLVQVV